MDAKKIYTAGTSIATIALAAAITTKFIAKKDCIFNNTPCLIAMGVGAIGGFVIYHYWSGK